MTVLHNPVIRGFAPDPSLVRAGDWYYLATSSFEWFPTIPIHRSRDLAHWEYAGHVEGAAPGDSLAGVPDSGGIWAPSLSWDGVRFWVTYSIVRSVGTRYFDLDTYVSTAMDVPGPWTPPRRVPSHGFDPALFHDNGRIWLLNIQNDHRPGGRRFAGIVATELDPETLTTVGTTRLLLQHDGLIEGPKLLKRDGWYVLVLAEGGTGFEHGVRVARSRNLTGPYDLDERPLLTTRDDPDWPLQKAGHAELVQTPEGAWFLSHLTARPLQTPQGPRCPLGRETAIQAVTWDAEGWPRLRHGDTRPALTVETPQQERPLRGSGLHTICGYCRVGATSPHRPAANSTNPYFTLRSPADPSWIDPTTRPGWLRLRGHHGPDSLWSHNLLARRITEHRTQAQVTLQASPSTFTQAAGLLLWYNTSAYYALDLTWSEPEGEAQHGQQWQHKGRTVLTLTARDEGETRRPAVVEVDATAPLTLGVTVDGADARFWYETDRTRHPLGPPLDFTRHPLGPPLDFTRLSEGVSDRLWVAWCGCS
ncbi:xylan 1,4-beta-xylosidase [Streptomyces sp. Ag109_O5-1]|uniref:family 43 glycosylhydrolase n=1 Tax=Streptomyces sp. Ag109_O5-1 TaxID=1938851 RepID=UPI000F4E6338|nr:family 43 glycosylhydrolase [Streptomyces sp. Ag109_O5-1]RPE39487.1 xylan 1,4-beta-xylosidase [Streptomyces sp. Ag109_O5-1]